MLGCERMGEFEEARALDVAPWVVWWWRRVVKGAERDRPIANSSVL